MLQSSIRLIYSVPPNSSREKIEETIISVLQSSKYYSDIVIYTSKDSIQFFKKLPCKIFTSDRFTDRDLFFIEVLRLQESPFILLDGAIRVESEDFSICEMYLSQIEEFCEIDSEVLQILDELHKPHYHMIVDCSFTYDFSLLIFNNIEIKKRLVELLDLSLDLVSKVEDTETREKITIQTIFQYVFNYLLQEREDYIVETKLLQEIDRSLLEDKFKFWRIDERS